MDNEPVKAYIVWDTAKTEGYVTLRKDEAEFAAGIIESHQVDGFYTEGVSSLAHDWRSMFEDELENLTIQPVTISPESE